MAELGCKLWYCGRKLEDASQLCLVGVHGDVLSTLSIVNQSPNLLRLGVSGVSLDGLMKTYEGL